MGKLAAVWQWFLGLLSDDEPINPNSAKFADIPTLERRLFLKRPDDSVWKHEILLGSLMGESCDKTKGEGSCYLCYADENHLFTMGKPGCGKGARTIIPTLFRYQHSCVVIDPKGQNSAVTAHARGLMGQNVFILNPYNVLPGSLNGQGENVHNLAGYNPLDRIDPASDSFVADVRSLAQALIVYQGNETHWADSARELVAAFIMHVCLTREGDRRNLGEVRALLSAPVEPPDAEGNRRGFLATVGELADSPFLPLAQKAGQFKEATNEIKSIISTARTQLAFLDDPAIRACLSRSDFRFIDLKRQKETVYLVLPFKQLEAQGRWLRLLITSAIEELTEEPKKGDERVLFILDEFAQLGRLAAIERALALVRGYGVQLWPFVQDLPQLKSIYPDRWESFLSTAGVVQFFPPNDITTANYISERAGKTLRTRKSSSESSGPSSSSSKSVSEHWEPLVTPYLLYGLPQAFQFLFFESTRATVTAESTPYYLQRELYPHAKPDPFHS